MNAAHYAAAVEYADSWIDTPIPHPMQFGAIHSLDVRVGVYFACRADGQLLYIGSCSRPHQPYGIARRICEHPAARRARWWYVWVLPLRCDTPIAITRSVEGVMISNLRPPLNQRMTGQTCVA